MRLYVHDLSVGYGPEAYNTGFAIGYEDGSVLAWEEMGEGDLEGDTPTMHDGYVIGYHFATREAAETALRNH